MQNVKKLSFERTTPHGALPGMSDGEWWFPASRIGGLETSREHHFYHIGWRLQLLDHNPDPRYAAFETAYFSRKGKRSIQRFSATVVVVIISCGEIADD